MSVGEALAEARSRAGLSVDELSERTRIRTAVIRCIERDDYDACGGDLFVRGYVRALADAVGIDADPLIREYNRARVESSGEGNVTRVARIQVPAADPAVTAPDPAVPAADPQPPAADVAAGPLPPAADVAADPLPPAADVAADPLPPAADVAADPQPPAANPEETAADLPVVHANPAVPLADPEVTVADLPIVSEDPAPTVADLPVIPAEPTPPPERPRVPGTPPTRRVPGRWLAESPGRRARPGNRRGMARVAIPTALLLAVAGVVIGFVASSRSAPPAKNATAFSQHPGHAAQTPLGTGKTGNSGSSGTGATSASTATAKATGKPAAKASPAATAPSTAEPAPVTALHIAGAMAFGPEGLADGDNPQVAQYAVRSGSPGPWQSQWYATADFGNLKHGTGLLIDMGSKVTMTSVLIDLAGYRGANLQLLVGDSANSLGDLQVAAHANDVGGTVRLQFSSPQNARYLLIWFTLLPPNGAGQYQASVYRVVVNGPS